MSGGAEFEAAFRQLVLHQLILNPIRGVIAKLTADQRFHDGGIINLGVPASAHVPLRGEVIVTKRALSDLGKTLDAVASGQRNSGARPIFEHGKPYPIETLPDDLHDRSIPNRDRWAIREVLLWNDCQGWWTENVSEYWTGTYLSAHGHVARFWSPLPPDPMTREEILAERGMVVCPGCDCAIDQGKPHNCPGPSDNLIEQRRLQAIADAAASQE